MAERYWRVLATTTRTDEFFVEVDEFVNSPEAAMASVKADAHQGLDPENENVGHPMIVSVRAEDIWVIDENGDRLATSDDVAPGGAS